MLTEGYAKQQKIHVVTLEQLVPQSHLLRKIEAAVDFSFIYDEVRELYSLTNGRPSIDPVIIIKYLLIGFLFGILSERRIEQEIQVNVAYRWFLGIELDEQVPDHSTISQLRRRKFNNTDLFRKIFERVVTDCISKRLVTGDLILTDSTHMKANTSPSSELRMLVEQKVSAYAGILDQAETQIRKKLEEEGRIKPRKKHKEREERALAPMVEKRVSKTDPEAGKLVRPGKPLEMCYLDHQSIDAQNGIIVEVTVTPGDAADAAPYLEQIEKIKKKVGKIKATCADSAYDTGIIHQSLLKQGVQHYVPIKTYSANTTVEFTKDIFAYDKNTDTYWCPNAVQLTLRSLNRDEYTLTKVYKSRSKDCKGCPLRNKCLSPSATLRSLRVSVFRDAVNEQRKAVGSSEYSAAIRARQILCEGTFAAQKARHNLRQIFRRGLKAAEDHCLLSATAMNLKRMVKCMG